MDYSRSKGLSNRDNSEFDTSANRPMYDEELDSKVINAESLQFDTTLNDISNELRPGETLVLDIGNNYYNQTDEIYDTLVMRGYDVRKSFKNGRNQILVSKAHYKDIPSKRK